MAISTHVLHEAGVWVISRLFVCFMAVGLVMHLRAGMECVYMRLNVLSCYSS